MIKNRKRDPNNPTCVSEPEDRATFKKRRLNKQREKEAEEELKEVYENIGRTENTNQK